MLNVLEELRRMDRFYSDESKWCQGAFSEGDARCIVGAAGCNYPVCAELRKSLRLRDTPGLMNWNDERARTFADVKNLLAYTIERVSREGKTL